MLRKIKNSRHHYYQDKRGRIQGEFKAWWEDGTLREHSFFKNFSNVGEYKRWHENGSLEDHYFFQTNDEITDQVKALVVDILNITQEEKMIIKLKFGIECLP